MAKLWQKSYTLDTLMEEFSVANDYLVDQELVIADALASIAHARTLQKLSLLSQGELSLVEEGLREVILLRQDDAFPIHLEDEDCHTAIEAYLTETKGEVGKKIHTGRSRNDQVQTALRLWMREFATRLALRTLSLVDHLFAFADEHRALPMPGRTHMQIAMPSSVGLWAASFGEQLLDSACRLIDLLAILDQSPLGSAASYGSTLPLDRAFSASEMGFAKVQNNVLYANNSRGFFEAMLLDSCDYIALTLSKLAQDLLLFTLPELGYFSLPVELLTGSSIMPQKKNPDGLELARSRAAVIGGAATQVKTIIRSLPSGYNRDFQDTKGPLLGGARATWQLVGIFERMIEGLEVHEDRLLGACTAELYATDVVLSRVAAGEHFRDVYRDVGLNLGAVEAPDPVAAIGERTSVGTSGNLALDGQRHASNELAAQCKDRLVGYQAAYHGLCGLDEVVVVLY
ncbi:MAG: argininosuccinate lyase [Sphaerochaeta sp.]|jgi:argininosuccinate lyase|nr:argininosuccinate lyase [Sphaerochaeta sp.]MDX9914422.1 argininosuccinate lyase [Sphaerochaeta sp.]